MRAANIWAPVAQSKLKTFQLSTVDIAIPPKILRIATKKQMVVQAVALKLSST